MSQVEHRCARSSATTCSLSVERKNFAQQLYLSEGYQIVDCGDGDSDTMVKDLAPM